MAAAKGAQQMGAVQHVAPAGLTEAAKVADTPATQLSTPRKDRTRVSPAVQSTVPSPAPGEAPQPGVATSPAAKTAPGAGGPEPAPAVKAAAAPTPKYKDGTFTGWGECNHGRIQASVEIKSGRIASVAISKCETAYSCAWLADLLDEVVDRQSTYIDWVSGATDQHLCVHGCCCSRTRRGGGRCSTLTTSAVSR